MEQQGVWDRTGIPKPPEGEAFCYSCFNDLVRPSSMCRGCGQPHHRGCVRLEEPGRFWEIGNGKEEVEEGQVKDICPVVESGSEGWGLQCKERRRIE
eukprot:10044132-Karenia_brevis.AAC.1